MTAPRRKSWERLDGLALDEDAVSELPLLSDPHGYFTLDRVLGWVLSFALGAIGALVTVAVAGWCR